MILLLKTLTGLLVRECSRLEFTLRAGLTRRFSAMVAAEHADFLDSMLRPSKLAQ
jgi:hypothetical protein